MRLRTLTGWGELSSIRVSNVLNEEKKQQAIPLGAAGMVAATESEDQRVRREKISVYLRAAGIAMRPLMPGREKDSALHSSERWIPSPMRIRLWQRSEIGIR
jgi:hypothetical protein